LFYNDNVAIFGVAKRARKLRKDSYGVGPKQRFRERENNMNLSTPQKTRMKDRTGQALIGLAGLLLVTSTPSVFAESQLYEYVNPAGIVQLTNVPSDPKFQAVRPVGPRLVSGLELERAVARAAKQHHLHPALLFAVMKAESSFNPLVVSKAGAVGLMQLVPETAMRHGVRNLYDTNENVAGGARHLRYLLDRFHGNTRLALAAYNAGERKVDRYMKIPPYKETRLYVQKVLSYYRDYRKEIWLAPVNQREGAGNIMRPLFAEVGTE
jgi:soluble lytic murein transglycosylase-like protein